MTDMYRGARNLGRRQRLVLTLLADGPKSVRRLNYDWPTDCEEAVRESVGRLSARGLVEVAGFEGRAHTYRLTERGAKVERALAKREVDR